MPRRSVLVAAARAALIAGAQVVGCSVGPSALAALTPMQALAQPRQVREQLNGWLVLNHQLQLTKRWFVDSDLSVRRSGPVREMAQILPRPSLRFQPSSAVLFSWGYAFVETWPYGKDPVALRFPEHRMWQQMQLGHTIGRVALTHRYRLEQRWLGNVVQENGETRVQDWVRTNRVRYRVLSTIPLQGRSLDDGEFYATVGDELFVNWGANVQRNVLDQNRLSASIGRRFSPTFRLEVGYMEQLLQKSDGRRLERNHTIVVGVHSSASLVRSAGAAPAGPRAPIDDVMRPDR